MEELNVQNLPETISNDKTEVSLKLDLPFIKSLAGWATFKAVIDIISGALSCLGFILIFPAVYGVFRVISGVKLLNATDDLKRYIASNNAAKIADSFYNLNKYFKLSGIAVIVRICFIITVTIFYIALIVYLMSTTDGHMPRFDFYDYF